MNNDMREELKIRIINAVLPYINEANLSDLRFKLDIELANYEVTKRCTELAILTEGKNEAILKKFIAAKLAEGRTARTLKFYKNSLIFFFGRVDKDFDQITADDIRLFLAIRVNQDNVSKVTANNERRAISAFYSWLQIEEIVFKNPMRKIGPMKVNKKPKKAFSELEVELIRNACCNARETALVELLLSTWCRVSEVSQIKLTDMEEDKILVHGKGEKDRTVYLNAKTRVALNNYLRERTDTNPYLFAKAKYAGNVKMMSVANKGRKFKDAADWYKKKDLVDDIEHIGYGTIEGIIRKIGKSAGVENTHPHRFRRTGATMALRAGMPLTTVSKILGHAGIGVTQIYLDVSDAELEEAHRKFVK